MKLKEGFAIREIVGEKVIMPTGPNIAKFDGAVMLTETAAFAIEKLEKATLEGIDLSIDDLASEVVKEYDIDLETAKKDLTECFTKLKEIKVVE